MRGFTPLSTFWLHRYLHILNLTLYWKYWLWRHKIRCFLIDKLVSRADSCRLTIMASILTAIIMSVSPILYYFLHCQINEIIWVISDCPYQNYKHASSLSTFSPLVWRTHQQCIMWRETLIYHQKKSCSKKLIHILYLEMYFWTRSTKQCDRYENHTRWGFTNETNGPLARLWSYITF